MGGPDVCAVDNPISINIYIIILIIFMVNHYKNLTRTIACKVVKYKPAQSG